jgi:small subunit ribosomal protein S16
LAAFQGNEDARNAVLSYNFGFFFEEANLLVTMRLSRIGSKKRPYYRIVVIDKRRARNGRFLEVLGQYNPISNPAQMEINAERAQYWLSKGAAPSETVRSILRKKNL